MDPTGLTERLHLGRWRHAVKLDPDKPLATALVRRIAASGTDAVLIGGTQRITRLKVLNLLRQLRHAPVPVVLEVSSQACAVPGADAYFVPLVLNGRGRDWLIDQHLEGLRRVGAFVPWSRVLAEGYIIGNPDAAVARRVGVERAPGTADLEAYVRYGAGILRLPIVYLEYSGALADPASVAVAARALHRIRTAAGTATRLFYGGGIRTFSAARELLKQVDTIVVGNALYQPGALAVLEQTLAAVAEVRARSQ